MKLAVFDVCGTLYRSNTSFDFQFHLRRNQPGARMLQRFMRSLPGKALGLFASRVLRYELYRTRFSQSLSNRRVEEIQRAAQVFVKGYLADRKIRPVFALMAEYRAKGFTICLMSASYDFVVAEVARAVAADDYIASKIRRDGDAYASGYESDIQGRKHELLQEQYPDIQELVVVSDNLSDLALMQKAHASYAVVHKAKRLKFWQTHLPSAALIRLDS